MKNFLIVVLALGLAGSALLTRPDREEFDAYLRKRHQADETAAAAAASSPATASISIVHKGAAAARGADPADVPDADKLEFKDYYLWSVVRNKDGKTLFTGMFDHWLDNEQIRRCLPSSGG